MWKLAKPVSTAREAYLTCISRVRDPALKERLNSVVDEVVQASEDFEAAAQKIKLHTLVASDNVGGQVTKKEMSTLYTDRMVKKNAPGRYIYDVLLAAPAHGRCPLCGQRVVSTLDHYLPKDYFPALVVAPINLVPACGDCNKAKLDRLPRTSEQETLHPYFDDLEQDAWLHATLLETSPASVRFYVDAPASWDAIRAARVRHHFNVFGLSYLYASLAAEELLNIRHYLAGLFAEAGSSAIRDHLRERASSCERAHVNSWQTATYKALCVSQWYCAGGFN